MATSLQFHAIKGTLRQLSVRELKRLINDVQAALNERQRAQEEKLCEAISLTVATVLEGSTVSDWRPTSAYYSWENLK
ncbi:MAG TPA: hypothetical protein V6D20_01310, partial [Candidatus Obscuribacterales bacterium]